MSKRKSESARVMEFFERESLDVVDAIMGIVKEMIKVRRALIVGDAVVNVAKRPPRKPKAEQAIEAGHPF